jgi:hypothetical protein
MPRSQIDECTWTLVRAIDPRDLHPSGNYIGTDENSHICDRCDRRHWVQYHLSNGLETICVGMYCAERLGIPVSYMAAQPHHTGKDIVDEEWEQGRGGWLGGASTADDEDATPNLSPTSMELATENAQLRARVQMLEMLLRDMEAAEFLHQHCCWCFGESAPEACERCVLLVTDLRMRRSQALLGGKA